MGTWYWLWKYQGQTWKEHVSPHFKKPSAILLLPLGKTPNFLVWYRRLLGPSLQSYLQEMAHSSLKTCRLLHILCLFLSHPLSWWTTPSHSNITSSRKVSMILSDWDALQTVFWKPFVEIPLNRQPLPYCNDLITCLPPPVSPIMWQIFFKHLLCARYCSSCLEYVTNKKVCMIPASQSLWSSTRSRQLSSYKSVTIHFSLPSGPWDPEGAQ